VKRKPIQIAVQSHDDGTGFNAFCELYALCDDGTIWMREPWKEGSEWEQQPEIPPSTENNK